MPPECLFCQSSTNQIFYENDLVLGLWDQYPVSPGHALLIPRRHVPSWFDATSEEQQALLTAVNQIQQIILQAHQPDGFNIGFNDGRAAGQTVFHLHVHVIPRYTGDVADPTGGVRHVIPEKANYLAAPEPFSFTGIQPPHTEPLIRGEADPLLPHIRAHIDGTHRVDMAVAFTMNSGLKHIAEHLRDLLARGGHIRFLTGDYLNVTEPEALVRLLDLHALDLRGDIQVRVFQAGQHSFHPKAYLFYQESGHGTALVGSSNLSDMALGKGVEWNYRVVSSSDQQGFHTVASAFEDLFHHSSTIPLDYTWVSAYSQRRPQHIQPVEVPTEEQEPPPPPHTIQQEALRALEVSRQEGNQAGLIVLATGLGKTWLSAFDSHRPDYQRILFVAHREEILGQAMQTYRRIRPDAQLGFYTGQQKDRDAKILFASVQTLSRLPHLRTFDPQHFDYIVIDEFHHAAARTYRKLIDYFQPQFLLALTATPERTDGGDLLALCQENLVYRCDIPRGIEQQLLCPFHYYGVPDEVDYSNIPWRSNRFEEEALTNAVATQSRAQNALEQYREKGGQRTLSFCCSTRHANFMKRFFTQAGLRAAAVHSGEASDARATSLERLTRGELDIIFSVDMFNEGVDLPDVDTILMLRPTESRVLWLQQFGRGLRWTQDKTLKVIDYIGNHRSFLIKPQTLFQVLFAIGPGDALIKEYLMKIRADEVTLPPGCAITYDLKTIDILQPLFRESSGVDALKAYYLDFQERYDRRPLAVEIFHENYNPRVPRSSFGAWLHFMDHMGGLSTAQKELLQQKAGRFLLELETTPMTKSYKMLTLLAMLNADALPGQISLARLVDEVSRLARRTQRLQADITVPLDDQKKLTRLWKENPIAAWADRKGRDENRYFVYQDEHFQTDFLVQNDHVEAFQELVRELVDWRLADYLSKQETAFGNADRFVCRVIQSSGRPILKLPGKCEERHDPWGWNSVLIEGERYEAKFVKLFVNVISKVGTQENDLAPIMRRWFGEEAGQPGTRFQVAFERQDNGYHLMPLGQKATTRTAELWQTYRREDIPELFDLEFKKGTWQQQGFIREGKHTFLFVTLDKGDLGADFQHQDRFLSADRFQWQSQNRTTQQSKHGQSLVEHQEQGILIHLLVRRKKKQRGIVSPFYYCGELDFESWEGEKPITVWWRLKHAVPDHMHSLLQILANM